MHLTRQHALAAAVLAGLGLVASLSYLSSSSSSSRGAEASLGSEQPSLLASAATGNAATAKLAANLACDFEPLKDEVKVLRERAKKLAGVARAFAERVGLHDANLEAATAAITLPPPTVPAALAKMQDDVAQYDAAVARWQTTAGQRIDTSYEEFMKDLEQRVPALMVTTIPVEYDSAKKTDETLRTADVPASDPRRQEARAKIQLYRGQLIRYSSGLNGTKFEGIRFLVVHAQDPAATLAEYQADKGQYLAAKADADAAEQRYEAARLIPLPPQRTKDWRHPISSSN